MSHLIRKTASQSNLISDNILVSDWIKYPLSFDDIDSISPPWRLPDGNHAAEKREVVFIDTSIKNWQVLRDGVGNRAEVILIDTHLDGLQQMVTALKNYHNLDAIHILSHGNIGELQLGSTLLDEDNIKLYESQLKLIGDSLSRNGDLLIYGCEVAQGERGASFVQEIAKITHADIAASNDITGNSLLGGDWDLEIQTGSIEAERFEFNYDRVLNIFGTNGNDTLYGTSDPDAIYGWDGDDYINGYGSINFGDRIDGGAGYDTVVINDPKDTTLNCEAAIIKVNGDQRGGFKVITLDTNVTSFTSAGNGSVIGNSLNNTFSNFSAMNLGLLDGKSGYDTFFTDDYRLSGYFKFQFNSSFNNIDVIYQGNGVDAFNGTVFRSVEKITFYDGIYLPPSGNIYYSGLAKEDQTLSVANYLTNVSAVSFKWQYYDAINSNWVDIGSGISITLGDIHVGKTIRAVVDFSDNLGTNGSIALNSQVVANTNDAPTANNQTISISEDTAKVFGLNDFGFSDVDPVGSSGSTLQAIIIRSLPAFGVLSLNGANITLNQVVNVTDINLGNLMFTPASNANGVGYTSFGFKVSDGIVYSVSSYNITIDVAPVNDAPTLTTFAEPISTGVKNNPIFATFKNLQDQGDESDVDSSINAFVIKSITNGSLKIGADFSSASDWTPGTNDVVDAFHNIYWFPPSNTTGSINAFTVVALDDLGLSSGSAVQASINIVAFNTAPIFGSFDFPVSVGDEDNLFVTNFADLLAHGNEQDIDGVITGFVVTAVSTGTLKIGSSFDAATDWAVGTNDIVDLTHSAYWTPESNANGNLNAFSVVAKDNLGLESVTPVQAVVSVAAINDAPTFTTLSSVVATGNEDAQITVSMSSIAALSDAADIDGTIAGYVVKAVTSGTLLIGTTVGTATAWAAGSNDTIGATHFAFWTPGTNANGNLDAFTISAIDDLGIQSATSIHA